MKAKERTAKKANGASRNRHIAPSKNAPSTADVLTLEDAAAFLRVPVASVVAEAEAGRIPGRRISGEWRFLKCALLNWFEDSLQRRPRPLVGVGKDYDEDPEDFIRRARSA